MPQKSEIYKKRIVWWLNPWVIAIACVLILAAIPMVLWIATYKSTGAVMMFVITYIILLFCVLFMVKKSMLEPHLYVDEKEIERKRVELRDHRQKVQQEFLTTELEAIKRGERTPVLDIWRLNPQLQQRHPFIQSIETILLDPTVQELHFRIQIGELSEYESHAEPFTNALLTSFGALIKMMIADVYFQRLKQYVQLIVIEIYALRENPDHRNEPYPIFSMLLNVTVLQRLTYTSLGDLKTLKSLGDVRWNDGYEIPPHRGIESMRAGGIM